MLLLRQLQHIPRCNLHLWICESKKNLGPKVYFKRRETILRWLLRRTVRKALFRVRKTNNWSAKSIFRLPLFPEFIYGFLGIGGTKFISFEDRHWHNGWRFCIEMIKSQIKIASYVGNARQVLSAKDSSPMEPTFCAPNVPKPDWWLRTVKVLFFLVLCHILMNAIMGNYFVC